MFSNNHFQFLNTHTKRALSYFKVFLRIFLSFRDFKCILKQNISSPVVLVSLFTSR